MATERYLYEEFRNPQIPTQLQTRRHTIDLAGNRTGAVEVLGGGADQYRSTGTVITCVAPPVDEFIFSTVINETDYAAYLEFRPANQCSANPLYSTGFGMPPKTTVRVLPENIKKIAYCLHFSTPGKRSRLVDEFNRLILTTDGVTPGTIASHTPLTKYKVLVGIDVVSSFKVTNSLPVSADVIIRDCGTGTVIKQTPVGGIAAGGSYEFLNMDKTPYCISVVATGMVGRTKRAQLLNNNNLLLTSTDGTGPGTFPGFSPQSSPFGDLRIVEEGSVGLNDLQISLASSSRYVNGVQQVIFLLSSASVQAIGPFTFRVQNPFTDQIIARADRVDYGNGTGYVLNMPTSYSGPARLRATAHRGTTQTTDDWEAIDQSITMFPDDATFIKNIAVKYEGLEVQGRQTVLLLLNSTFDGSNYKWDGRTAIFQSLIATVNYPGFTHFIRLFGDINAATFDSVQTFNISPKTPSNDIVTVTYVRGTDSPGTIRSLFGSAVTNSQPVTVVSIEAKLVNDLIDNTGGGGGGLVDAVYQNTFIDFPADPAKLNIGIQWTLVDGKPMAKLVLLSQPPSPNGSDRNMWWINGHGPDATIDEPYYSFPTDHYYAPGTYINVVFGQGPSKELFNQGFINKAQQTGYVGKANT